MAGLDWDGMGMDGMGVDGMGMDGEECGAGRGLWCTVARTAAVYVLYVRCKVRCKVLHCADW